MELRTAVIHEKDTVYVPLSGGKPVNSIDITGKFFAFLEVDENGRGTGIQLVGVPTDAKETK